MAAHWKRTSSLVATLLLSAALLVGSSILPSVLKAQSQTPAFPRTLEDVKIFGRGETVQFVFSQPYDGIPSEDHAPGRMALTFVGVGSQKPVRDLRPKEESLYKEIKVVQNRYSTTVTFLLRDPKMNLKDRIAFGRDGKVFNVEIQDADGAKPSSTAAQPVSAGKATPLLSELEQKIGGPGTQSGPPPAAPAAERAPAPTAPVSPSAPLLSSAPRTAPALAPLGGLPDSNFFATLATMIVALVIMVAGLYGVLYLYKKYIHSRLARFAGTPAIRQIASFSIGPRQRIVILEINEEWIACGVTPSQITFLTRLSGKQHPADAETPAVAQSAAPEPSAGLAVEPAKTDPVHQFAEVLKQKVRSLKRIN